jgi:hypothetical protein
MSKKKWNILLLCVEIGLLLLLSPIIFMKAYRIAGPKLVELIYHYFSSQASNWLIGIIFVASITSVVFIMKSRLIRNQYIKVVAIWIVLMLAALTMLCLRLPFVRWA